MSDGPRAVAIAIIRRDDEILVFPVPDEVKGVTGWRAPGGGIEFGERSDAAVVREVEEELGLRIVEPRHVTTIENIFEYRGATGHELVFVYEARFADDEEYGRESFDGLELGGDPFVCVWRDLDSFEADAPLYPEGLRDLLR